MGIGVSLNQKAPYHIYTHVKAKEHQHRSKPLCTDMIICTQSVFKGPEVSVAGLIFPKSPLYLSCILLSTLFHPKPHFHFCLCGELRFISLVDILDCQSDQLPVSRALHGSSNYIPVQLAWVHVAVGQLL